MRIQKNILLASLIIGIIALILAVFFNFGRKNEFASGIFNNIFAGAIVAFVVALIMYLFVKFNHTKKLVLSLYKLYGHLSSCVNNSGEYKRDDLEIYRLMQLRSQFVYVYNKILERCEEVSLILLEEDVLKQDKRDKVLDMLVKLEEQIFSSKFALECEVSPQAIKAFIDVQLQKIVDGKYIDNTKSLLLEITKKYPKYYVNFEEVLTYPYAKEETL